MYRVNGELVGRYMSAQSLKDGDSIELYFTSDWMSEPGAEGWQEHDKAETVTNEDGSTAETETKADGAVVEATTKPDGNTRVDIPVSKPSGSMVAVIVHPDGTGEIVKGSVVTETGIALRA